MALDGRRVCFNSSAGFCSDCGSILPLLGDRGTAKCHACGRILGSEVFGDMAMTYCLAMTELNAYEDTKVKEDEEKEEEAEGPVVDRK